MGLWHQGANGTSPAPLDVCLTPPPPPAGPVPVPYVNVSISRNLKKGSKSVKIQAKPTALEGKSKTEPTNGDQPGTQGGGVVSHKTTGAGEFTTWDFTVKIEGSGVACMGDIMTQNTNGTLKNCMDPAAIVQFAVALMMIDKLGPCDEKYDTKKHRPSPDPTKEQTEAVDGKPCWECKRDDPNVTEPAWNTRKNSSGKIVVDPTKDTMKTRGDKAMTHDHQPPLNIAWEMGGCHLGEDKFKELFSKKEMVVPHCDAHAKSQGGQLRHDVSRLRRGMAS